MTNPDIATEVVNKEQERPSVLLELVNADPNILDAIVTAGDYWKKRCLAAENIIVSRSNRNMDKWKLLRDNFPIKESSETSHQ